VLQLHKQGLQNLVIHSVLSPSGLHWRCELHAYSSVAVSGDGHIQTLEQGLYEDAIHTNGVSGNQYFGWDDAERASARELAALISRRFPRLIRQCEGVNYEYSGWLCRAVGRAENGELPVMYSDYGSGRPDTGPLQRIVSIGGIPAVFVSPPHVREGEDWHTAYISLIEKWHAQPVRRLPARPRAEDGLFEHGAYWEGAVWYIQEVLGFRWIDRFIDALGQNHADSERWATFLAVWNSEGQLADLVAFLKRKVVAGGVEYRVDAAISAAYQADLQRYEAAWPRPFLDMPHPYFGGNNPLHVGLVLEHTGPALFSA
jgi:hypothetical protein